MEEEITQTQPINTPDTGRNPDGTWKKGFCPNMQGRKKNPLKEFSLKEFTSWTDEQKKEFLGKISAYDRWRMTEGNPATEPLELGGEITLKIAKEIADHYDSNTNTISDSEGQA